MLQEAGRLAGPVFFSLHDERGGEKHHVNPWGAEVIDALARIGCRTTLQRHAEDHRAELRAAPLVVALYDFDGWLGESHAWRVFPKDRLGVPAWTTRFAGNSVVAISASAIESPGITYRTAREIRAFFLREGEKSGLTTVHSGILAPQGARRPMRTTGALRLPFYSR